MPARADPTVVDLTAELVRAPSVLGNEANVASRLEAAMTELGYDEISIDHCGNLTGVVRGARDGPTVLLDGHMDTVDVMPKNAWSRDPWSGAVDDDRVWGRGSSDMKGAIAAMAVAVASLDRKQLRGRAVVSASVGEEQIEGAALREVANTYPPDFVIIGEATDLTIAHAGRGRAEVTIEAQGSPAHASSPDAGRNAVLGMQRILAEIKSLPMGHHETAGPETQCVTAIISDPYPAHSVVPSRCVATYERRLLPGLGRDDLLGQLRAACERAGESDARVELAMTSYATDTGITWNQPKWFPAWITAPEHQLVASAVRALNGVGQLPSLSSYQFCTNAAWSAGVADIPTIGYGPSREGLAHIVDEYVEIEQLQAAERGYAAIVQELLSAH